MSSMLASCSMLTNARHPDAQGKTVAKCTCLMQRCERGMQSIAEPKYTHIRICMRYTKLIHRITHAQLSKCKAPLGHINATGIQPIEPPLPEDTLSA